MSDSQPASILPSSTVSNYTLERYEKLKQRQSDLLKTNYSIYLACCRAEKRLKRLVCEKNFLLDNIARKKLSFSSNDENTNHFSNICDNVHLCQVNVNNSVEEQPEIHQRYVTKEINQSFNTFKTTVPSSPPKRPKISTVQVKARLFQPFVKDETGRPTLPQKFGVSTVMKLGEIDSQRLSFHNERYIFPIGYTISREYPSMVDPHRNTMITSTIIDGGDGPMFRVEAADMPGQPIIANSATGAWAAVIRQSNEIRQREHSNSASGPDYYGLKHPTIAKLIQDLPDAKKLQNYVWQNFVEIEPRAAKGVKMVAAIAKTSSGNVNGNTARKNDTQDDDDVNAIQLDNTTELNQESGHSNIGIGLPLLDNNMVDVSTMD